MDSQILLSVREYTHPGETDTSDEPLIIPPSQEEGAKALVVMLSVTHISFSQFGSLQALVSIH